MAGWSEILASAPILTLHRQGKVTWNTGLQTLLGDPKWVRLMWNPHERKLGVRAETSALRVPVFGLAVSAEPEGSEFMVDSANLLAEAGISVEETFSDTPTALEIEYYTLGYPYGPIYFITIP